MEKKNYLLEELSKEEKVYLKKIVLNTRRLYIKNNYDLLNKKDINWDNCADLEGESVLEAVLNRCMDELVTAVEFEKAISDDKLYNIVKALSLKEKMVLFSLYKEGKNIKQIAEELNFSTKTISRRKADVHRKILDQLLGGKRNV